MSTEDPSSAGDEPPPIGPDEAEGDVDELDQPAPVPEPAAPAADQVTAPVVAGSEADDLREAVEAAVLAREQLAAVPEQTEQELAQLRAHAQRLTADLRQEIAELELRALRLTERDGRAIAEQASQDVNTLEQQVNDLRDRLRAAERDREELIRQTRSLTERLHTRSRQLDASLEAARAIRDELPEAGILVLSAHIEVESCRDCSSRTRRTITAVF